MYLGGELLKSANVDGTLFGRVQVTAASAEVGRGADHPAAESERIVGEDCACRSVVVLSK